MSDCTIADGRLDRLVNPGPTEHEAMVTKKTEVSEATSVWAISAGSSKT